MLVVRPGQGVIRFALITSLVAALISLALAASASAVTFTVNSTGDEGSQAICEAGTAGCTLRGAIQAANASAAVPDEIAFSASFDGGSGSTIAVTAGSPLPEIVSPTEIDGGTCTVSGDEVPCVTIKGIAGFATLAVKANESVVESLRFDAGSVALRLQAQGGIGPGVEVVANTFTGNQNAITTIGTIGGSGNLIAGNTIDVPVNFNFGITISNGPNQVYGNTINGNGCCYTGIWIDGADASGNRIGGDTAPSENVINGFQNGAIRSAAPGTARNEIGRNRGEGNGPFINVLNGIGAPEIGSALQSSVSGTAEPESVVRVFRMPDEFGIGAVAFLGEAVADSSGDWKASFAAVPAGTFVAATQTLEGGTSNLSELTAAQADPPAPPSGCPAVQSQCPPPRPPPPPDTTKPKVTIKKAPKAKSKSTTAKFVFSADESGVKFECKLDKKPLARCYSPKTYKRLKPGKHVFKVLAVDGVGNVSAVVTRKFTVLKK